MSRQLISSKMVGLTLFYFIITLGNKKHISYGKLKDDDKSTENCLNQLGRQLDNNAKHRHASRTYEKLHAIQLKEIVGPEYLKYEDAICHRHRKLLNMFIISLVYSHVR